ncbi:MAG: DUF5011 domain-containing protein [Sulfurovum sp.]
MPFIGKNFKIFLWGSAVVLLTACGNEEGQRSVTAEENVGVITESNGTETSGFEDNATQIPETNTTVDQNSTDETGNTTEENTADEGNTTIPDADIAPPVITLNGEANITITNGEAYVEQGATATDNRDGDVNVTINGTVDTTQAGTYTITYSATDRAGNTANETRTVTVTVPQITSVSIESNATAINLGKSALLTVSATYADGHTEEITDNIVWEITPADSAEIKGNVLTATKDSPVSIKAKVDNLVSDALMLDIYWEVNGHRLPPEPDKALNDSTLLGIDVNNNGVRDDVERWIYNEYKDKHPIHIDIAMQAARGYKLVLETPEKAKEIRKIVNSSNICNWYYKGYAELFGEKLLVNERIDTKVFSQYFDTKNRQDTYWQYDTLLSGGVI